jgi:signal transduction histidine kinase
MVLQPSREVLLAEVERSGRLDGVELELTSRAGGGIWTLASTEQITLHDKRHRLSVFTDITARKRLERRLLTQHAIGRHLAATSEPRVAIPHVLEALCRCEGWELGAMWLADADAPVGCGAWRSPGVDEAAMSRLGLAPAELLDRMRATGDTAPSLVIPAPGSAVRSAIVFPVLRGELAIGLIALASRDGGGQRDTTEHGLLDSIGRLLGLFVERTRAQAALRELNVELERRVSERTRALETSNRDLEAFSSSVSHDLRAPLRAIHGFAEMLLDEFAAGLPGEAVELLGQIHASSDRLRGLIEGLLAFARLGRDGLHRAEIELDPLVRSVLDELLVGHRLGDRLELRVVPLGRCHADPALLRLVWMNLLDNALKYARSRERIVIEIGHELRGGEILYYVRDNGVGFDMAHADRLFGVFQRLHTATDFEGTGLGLANVRRIIEHHRGRVAAHSELGRGSRFEFTLGPEPTRS